MIYGYARVSSTEQNLDRQILALQKYVEPKNIVTDKQSGKNLDRPGYNALKGIFGLRPGDVLYIVSLDRLSRNKEDIKNEVAWFKAHKVRLMILDLPSSMVQVPENQEWIIDMITKGQFFFCHRVHQSRSRMASSVSMGMPNHSRM